MIPDAHTPCPGCAIQVRALYAAAQIVVAFRDLVGEIPRELVEPIEQLRIAVGHCTPLVEAHLDNQDHAHSLELVDARAGLPGPTTLVLERALPFDPFADDEGSADWRFVASLLESFLGERMKFERAWIMRASKGARTLADVRRTVRELRATAKGLSADMYLQLGEYLDELVPAIASVQWAPRVELAAGVNVMQLAGLPTSMQQLVIRSALEWVQAHEHDVVVVVPEAWQFIPEGRGTPVKLAALTYIRQGAALGNYLWLDSQDLGGVSKEILRSVPVWILGVQREHNEIKRTLANIPASVAKPKPATIATLGLGEFVACWQTHAIRTYVRPTWLTDDAAQAIARGEMSVEAAPRTAPRRPPHGGASSATDPAVVRPRGEFVPTAALVERFVDKGRRAQAAAIAAGAQPTFDRVARTLLAREGMRNGPPPTTAPPPVGAKASAVRSDAGDWMTVDALYAEIKARLIADAREDPRLLEVIASQPAIRVKVERHTIQVDDSTLRGRLALLIADGFFDDAKESGKAFAEVTRRGFKTAHPNVARELQELARMGFLTRSNKWYQAVPGMARHITTD